MFSCEYYKIFKNIYFEDYLQTAASASWSILYKEFVDISYDNASFGIQEDSIWLQLIYCLAAIAFWFMKYLFRILCVVFITQIRHYGKFMALDKLISILFTIDELNQVKIPCAIMRSQGYFLKIAPGTRLFPIYLKK